MDKSGSVTGSFTGGLKLGSTALSSVSLTLNSGGLSGSGTVTVLGQNVSVNLTSEGFKGDAALVLAKGTPFEVKIPGTITVKFDGSISGSGSIVLGGTTVLTGVSFGLSTGDELTGSGKLSVGQAKLTSSFKIRPDGRIEVSGSYGVSFKFAAWTISGSINWSGRPDALSGSLKASIKPGLTPFSSSTDVTVAGDFDMKKGVFKVSLPVIGTVEIPLPTW